MFEDTNSSGISILISLVKHENAIILLHFADEKGIIHTLPKHEIA